MRRSSGVMRKLIALLALAALPLVAAEKPAPPADLTSPPADAERSEDGLVSKKLADGTGDARVPADGLAKLRYTVWKADGTLVQHVAPPQSLTIGVRSGTVRAARRARGSRAPAGRAGASGRSRDKAALA
jgi:hypothetical protein